MSDHIFVHPREGYKIRTIALHNLREVGVNLYMFPAISDDGPITMGDWTVISEVPGEPIEVTHRKELERHLIRIIREKMGLREKAPVRPTRFLTSPVDVPEKVSSEVDLVVVESGYYTLYGVTEYCDELGKLRFKGCGVTYDFLSRNVTGQGYAIVTTVDDTGDGT